MRNIQVQSMNKIKKAVPAIENKIKIKVGFGKSSVSLKGAEVNEFLCENIVRAIDFGFDVQDALLLSSENFVLEFIDIKEHTRRKNMHDVRARVIGTNGKARKTIEKLTGSVMVIHDNDIGIIVDSDHLDAVVQGIESLIQGAKHANVFSYLEKQNASRQRFDREDLGLKEGFNEGDIKEESEEISEEELEELEKELE
jgi:ribosomal RNA assembly protein